MYYKKLRVKYQRTGPEVQRHRGTQRTGAPPTGRQVRGDDRIKKLSLSDLIGQSREMRELDLPVLSARVWKMKKTEVISNDYERSINVRFLVAALRS